MLKIFIGEKIKELEKLLIVGVDPGTTTGVAILNIYGELLDIFSGKNLSEDEIIKRITNYGSPLVFVTDKSKVPSLVEKLSDRFLVDYFSPNKDLKVDFKKKLVNEFLKSKKLRLNKKLDYHLIDALASALYYYKQNRDRINQLIKKFGEKSYDLLKYGYIKEKDEKEIKKIEKIIKEKPEKFEELLKLKKENYFKDLYIKKLKKELRHLKEELKKLKKIKLKSEELRKLKKEVSLLRNEMSKLKEKEKKFSEIIKKIIEDEFVVLYDWKEKKYSKPSFISEDDLLVINKDELKKYEKLVKERDLSSFFKFDKFVIAKKIEVENALKPKENEIKKIIEYLKIYKERRKKEIF